jgi:hypothetical protein
MSRCLSDAHRARGATDDASDDANDDANDDDARAAARDENRAVEMFFFTGACECAYYASWFATSGRLTSKSKKNLKETFMKPTERLRAGLCAVLLCCCVLLPAGASSKARKKTQTTAAQPAKSQSFKPACSSPSYPSPPPKTSPGIDSQCGLNGSGTGAEGQQNSVKNNFCAKGTPRPVTIDYLTSLQAQVEKNKSINFGDENTGTRKKGPTTDRAPLRKLGEGRLVTLKAYVLIARQEGGESVNCGKNVPNQAPYHDIHISLVASTDETNECAGVVAEMSPHHRPDAWTHTNVERLATAKLPVRVTGQLYFDSSHVPCSNGQGVRSNPRRVSLWEIHPIYKFEVCTANCDGAGTWLPLDQWAQQQ